jgi:hypothetical protein
VLFKNAPALIDESVERAIAQYANPMAVTVESGEKLSDALERNCPAAGPAYYEVLERWIAGRTENAQETSVAGVSSVVVPYCIGKSFYRITLSENSPGKLFESQKSRFKREWQKFLNDIKVTSGITDESEFENLPDKFTLKVPPPIIEIRAQKDSFGNIVDAIGTVYGASAVEAIDTPESGVQQVQDEDCNFSQGWSIDRAARDFAAISEAYHVNRIEQRRRTEGEFGPVNIVVLDSGVQKVDDPLYRSLVKGMGNESDMYSLEEPPRIHAEQVVGAIGGFFSTIFDFLSRDVLIYSYNIYEERQEQCDADGVCAVRYWEPSIEKFRTGIDSVPSLDGGPTIVNLSQTFPADNRNGDLKGPISSSSNILLVSAAGNDEKNLQTGDGARFPPLYGGEETSNIIVVAGLDADSMRTEGCDGTNYGSGVVDIGAIARHVPTMQYDKATSMVGLSFANGTSVAAPSVAYAASLIYRLRHDRLDPVDVKKRIIFSSDINGLLEDYVKDGRVLNIARAINLYSDAVTRVSNDEYSRGVVRLSESDEPRINLCENPLVTDDVGSVRKISRIVGGTNDGKFLIYLETGGRVMKHVCMGRIPSIFFLEAGSEETVEIKPDELQDVTFAMTKP